MKILYLILLLFHSLQFQAQDSFNSYFDFDSRTSTFRSLLINHDTILLQGIFLDTVEPYLQGMAFAKVDTFGSLISYQRYFDPFGRDLTYPPVNNLIRISDGRFLTVGMTLQDNALLLIFLTSEFLVDTVYEYFANDPTVQVNWIRSVFELNDGYLVFGSAQRLPFSTDGQIFKINKKGDLLWRKWYGLPERDEWIGDVVMYSDSTFVVGSFQKPFPVDSENKMRNTWIFQVQQNGNILKEFLDPDPFSGTSGGLVIDKNDNLYYTGSSIIEDEYGQHNALGRIGMLNSHLELQWKKSFGKNLSINTGLSDMILTSDKLIAIGTYVDTFTLTGQGARRPHFGWTIAITTTGDSVCERFDTAMWYLPISSIGKLIAVDTLSSGNIIACGDGRFGPTHDYNNYAWLVKMTNLPCEGLKVGTIEIVNSLKTWKINPNPAKESVLIYFSHGVLNETTLFCVYNDLGQMVRRTFTEFGDDHVAIDLRNLTEGLYIVHSINETGQLTGVEKLIIVK